MAEYASQSVGSAGLTTGIIGSALGVLNSGLFNGGLFGNANSTQYASKADLENAILLAQKDSEIAMLKAEQASEVKMQDIYERVMTKVNANYAEQTAINTQQAVYNSTANANMSVLNNQVAQLMGLCTLKVNADNVCPHPMPQYNSWTAPTTTTTTT